jgi:glycosyltransferase involved in cell wall biosynthesis
LTHEHPSGFHRRASVHPTSPWAPRPKRLAILGCRGIPARYGGFETFAEELGTRLVARGIEVTVYCEVRGGRRGAALPRAHRGVRLEHVRVPAPGPLGALVYDLRALRHARGRHDVVYMLGYGAGAFLDLARTPGTEVWVNMDGLEWRRSKWGRLARAWLRRMERAALRRAGRVVFDSAAVRDAVLGPEGEATVIEYGAELEIEDDPAVLAGLGVRPHGYYLVVARIEPENHVLEILRAFARAHLQRELLVVGDVAGAGRYGALCRAAAGPGVTFLGALFDRRTLHALRRDCAAVVHGHSVGGTNPALLEAMAARAAVIAHANPFNREVLGHRGAYFRDEDELVRVLRETDGWSAAERMRQGQANRARIVERYTWDRIADAYAALLGGAAAAPVGAHASEPLEACRVEPAPVLPGLPGRAGVLEEHEA